VQFAGDRRALLEQRQPLVLLGRSAAASAAPTWRPMVCASSSCQASIARPGGSRIGITP